MKNLILVAFSAAISHVCISQAEQEKDNSHNERTVISANEVQAVNAQSNTKVISRPTNVTISKRAGEEQKVHDATYFQDEINKIDYHINAINTKVDHVNSIPSEKELATASGWFDQMNVMLAKLNTKKSILQVKLDEFNLNH